jgi:hypothetical protein
MEDSFKTWGILELMGHRKMCGEISEQQIGGAGMVRIDVPNPKGEPVLTQYYSPQAVYCITPTTEEIARSMAARMDTTPPAVWGYLPQPEEVK